MRKYKVYLGKLSGKVVYVGTTVQKLSDRWRWHKANGKDFNFEFHSEYDSHKKALEIEFELIKKHNPKYNKIKHRIQNFNGKLSGEELKKRVGDKTWCQICLKRRVNKKYKYCLWCS